MPTEHSSNRTAPTGAPVSSEAASRGGHAKPPDAGATAGHDDPSSGSGRRPSPEVIGGAVGGGVLGALAFGPGGAVAGMLLGAVLAAGTTRHFAAAAPR